MKVLIYLGHPAHYHNVRNAANGLVNLGHEILYVVREKDVLTDLLKNDSQPIIVISSLEGGTSKMRLFATVLLREIKMTRVAYKFKPDILVGTDLVITHVGKLFGIPSLVLNEDDAAAVPLLAHLGFRYATHVVSPRVCNIEPYEHKKIAYESYHELGYLHPNHFSPDRERIAHLFKNRDRYFILRFSKLSAHHDSGKKGITDDLARKIISVLEPHGEVHITSERPLIGDLDRYRVSIDPMDMHHALYFADVYIGDSQTMTAEAAVLGTPAIRFNDFVGKLSYLEELEEKYGLTIGIPASEPDRLLETIRRIVLEKDLGAKWGRRRRRMLSEKIDFAAFLVELLTQYPDTTRSESGERIAIESAGSSGFVPHAAEK